MGRSYGGENKMKLADLKQGMVCELRNGYEITFLDNNTGIYYYNDRINIISR